MMPTKPRILIYSSEFLPFKGGVGRYAEDMANLLSADGFAQVTVFTETGNKKGYPERSLPFHVARFPNSLFARHPWLNLLLNIYSSLGALLYARVQAPTWFICTGKRAIFNAMFFQAFLGKTALAIVIHGSELLHLEEAEGWRGNLMRKAFRRACQASRLILISNRYAINQFNTLPFAESAKIRLLYPIIDPDRIHIDPTRVEHYRKAHFAKPLYSFVTLARLTPRKGQDMVIRALSRFAREVTDQFHYFIIGRGVYREELNRLISAEGLDGRVTILESLDDLDAYALTSLCDLFVMPNREHKGTVEGFGISFLEGNLLGLPALAGKSGGSTEAVEEGGNGLVCDGDDPDDVYRQIRRFHDDAALRAGLKAGCRAHALERFSFAKWKGPYQDAFR